MDNIFEIRNLVCEYKKGNPVLNIEKLNIPKGKIVFIIGRSGIGKSTLIETLGLMNQTIATHSDSVVTFIPNNDKEKYNIRTCWKNSNQELSLLRQQHFSFIFQSTNLMPNFTSGENMAVSLMIKGRTFDEAKVEVLKMMKRLLLDDEKIFYQKTTEISGGQRQRLAFVRAITSNFSVLFGDEPTGNLDKNTAYELMTILQEEIKNKGKTAIIVSHDLVLATHFADMIIPITVIRRDNGLMGGNILESNIIENVSKENAFWIKMDGTECKNTLDYLNEFLLSN